MPPLKRFLWGFHQFVSYTTRLSFGVFTFKLGMVSQGNGHLEGWVVVIDMNTRMTFVTATVKDACSSQDSVLFVCLFCQFDSKVIWEERNLNWENASLRSACRQVCAAVSHDWRGRLQPTMSRAASGRWFWGIRKVAECESETASSLSLWHWFSTSGSQVSPKIIRSHRYWRHGS